MKLRHFVVLALVGSVSACSTSDKAAGPDAGGTSTDAGGGITFIRSDGGPSQVDAGNGSAGEGVEGEACRGAFDCSADLICVDLLFADQAGTPIGTCARGCTSDNDCGVEVCDSPFTNLAEDLHCVNMVREEYGMCGVADTAACANDRICLLVFAPDGVCVDLCLLDTDEDAGVSFDPTGLVTCSGTQTCIDEVLATNDPVGVCGTEVARGERCASEEGIYCLIGDLCAADDFEDPDSEFHCYQDCSARDVTCDTGTCTDIRGQFAYCL